MLASVESGGETAIMHVVWVGLAHGRDRKMAARHFISEFIFISLFSLSLYS